MRRRDFISVCAGFLASSRLAAAETTKDIAHVGILTMGSEDSVLDAAFRQGLVDLGYAEGKNRHLPPAGRCAVRQWVLSLPHRLRYLPA